MPYVTYHTYIFIVIILRGLPAVNITSFMYRVYDMYSSELEFNVWYM